MTQGKKGKEPTDHEGLLPGLTSLSSYVYPVRSLLSGIQASQSSDPQPPAVSTLNPNTLSSDNVQQFTTDIRGRGPSKSSQVQSWTRDVNDASHTGKRRRGSFAGTDAEQASRASPLGGDPSANTPRRPHRAKSTSGAPTNQEETRQHRPRMSDPQPSLQSPLCASSNPRDSVSANGLSGASSLLGASEESSGSGEYDSAPETLPFNLAEMGLVHLPPIRSSTDGSRRSMRSSRSSGLVTPSSAVRPSISRSNSSLDAVSPSPLRPSNDPLTDLIPVPEESPPISDEPDVSPLGNDNNSIVSMAISAEHHVAHRFEHREDENGHHVIIGREGTLARCEDEPIRTPGACQGFGVLIVLDEDEENQTLVVRQVSENSGEILGFSPRYLFSLTCFTDVLSDDQADHLWDNIQFLNEPEQNAEEEQDSPHVFLLTGWGAPGSSSDNDGDGEGRRSWTCWCAVHRPTPPPDTTGGPSLIIMEFELERDPINPLYPPFSSNGSAGNGSPGGSSGGSSGNILLSEGNLSSSADGSDRTLVAKDQDPGMTPAAGASPAVSATSSATILTPMSNTDAQDPLNNITTEAHSNTPTSLRGLEGDDTWTPSPEDILESTTSYSKPLSALERLRRMSQNPSSPSVETGSTRRGGRRRGASKAQGVGMMDIFAVMGQINEQLGAATQLEELLKITVGVIKDLTQFHRILVYQFDEVWNGQVVAELVDWSQTHDLYRGLHFPASDIPAQARELYAINKVRLLYDRSQKAARIVTREAKDLEQPLDMTHCFLRAMSPIHIKYLGNMSVRASMSISIMAFGSLWGLVTCHSYGDHGMRVSFPVRQMLRLLSQSVSRNIERLSYARRLHTRKLINTMTSDNHPTGYIVSTADDLLGLFDADFGILVIGEGAKILGPNVNGQEILIMAEYLRLKRFNNIQASQEVTADYPDLQLSAGFELVAGLLYVPLSQGGQDFIAFLRKSQPREVHWAGKPFKDQNQEARLEPRKSFRIWSETVAGRCRAWTDEQLETAGVLALVYGKFIEVWRQKETALQTTKLTNLLLSNASHEVRTPLNHIINYLEMALSGSLDGETRENLSRSHAASKSLLFTINDLLDLTRLESGNETSFNEPFSLSAAIEDATQVYRNEAERRDISFTIDVSQCPQVVVGDSKKITTVVQNLTANALKYTQKGYISVYCVRFGEPEGLRDPSQTAVEIIVADTGCGIQPNKLESIFREFEQVESSSAESAEQSSISGVGLGLAVVARIVEQLGGQLRVDSKVDEGSRFSFLIPLALPESPSPGSDLMRSPAASLNEGSSNSRSRGSSAIGSNASNKSKSLVQQLRSSRNSQGSSIDVDGFVDAISTSHMGSPSILAHQQNSAPGHAGSPKPSPLGSFSVSGSSIPVRPVKMDEYQMDSHTNSNPATSAPSSSLPDGTSIVLTMPEDKRKPVDNEATTEEHKLRVLIVEDNEINRTILCKRLRNNGHIVINTTNGQEGLDKVKSDREFDCILMDIQMPILNGFESTEQIRSFEKKNSLPLSRLSQELNGRIPVFAVSASLVESQRNELWDYGIDGWILKPINFKRLNEILKGVTNPVQREKDLYMSGCNWEDGGWLYPPYRPPTDTPASATAA